MDNVCVVCSLSGVLHKVLHPSRVPVSLDPTAPLIKDSRWYDDKFVTVTGSPRTREHGWP